ncbi:ninein-like protein isoform X3 [Syngnathus typhle]|uniref:ninein-like protein isoform X3 n=1 Tax=Syngnathus typhle TaxID=161592 RepID=UPI002A6A52D3|nr:ninein-like protein isoform X3 [Syngnathus typhle]
MEEAEPSVYVAQLKAEFDSFDTASSGFLGEQEVTALCRKLHLDPHLPLLLDSLLGGQGGACTRVDFEAFKENFVEVLSRSQDLTSDDDSNCLRPVVADQEKPKFVKGEKRYGRRSRPDVMLLPLSPSSPQLPPSDDMPPPTPDSALSSPTEVGGPKIGRAASLVDIVEEHGMLDQVSLAPFKKLLCGSTPVCCSTPHRTPLAPEEGSLSENGTLLTAWPGPRVLSRLDDGSGRACPERVVALWRDEGVRDARDILQTLDFPVEARVSLRELTLALENELLGRGDRIHQVALICYKDELQHLRACWEQACGERDKARADLERTECVNLRLLHEADERLAGMEALSWTRIRELERDFRERLAEQRSQAEQESDAAVQQLEQERQELQEQLIVFGVREAEQRKELAAAAQEKAHLEEEVADVTRRLSEAENCARHLCADLKQLLQLKSSSSDPEDRQARLLEDCERRCRELRDQNDELSSKLESHRSHEKSRRKWMKVARSEAPSSSGESDSDHRDMKRRSSPPRRATVHPDDTTVAVSIETEFAVEKLKSKHKQEIQQLNIQMETQVNYYEHSLDRMRQSMEVERKDIAQAFKLEISELGDQKAKAEHQVTILKEALDKVHYQLQHSVRSFEQEHRMQRQRADSEQNFAREIRNLVQRLNAEKDQLEAELNLKMDQEVMMVRNHLDEAQSDNAALQEHLCLLRQEVDMLNDEVTNKRSKLEELKQHGESSRQEVERLRQEVRQLQEEAELQWKQRLRLEEELRGCRRKMEADDRQMMKAELRRDDALGEKKAECCRVAEELSPTQVSDLHRILSDSHRMVHKAESNRKLMKDNERQDAHNRQLLEQAQAVFGMVQQEGAELREKVTWLLARLQEEQMRSRRLEEELQLCDRQSAAHVSLKEEQYVKVLAAARQSTQELEVKLKASRAILHKKVQQLQQQVAKNVKSSQMLKELYLENSQLMTTLQLTERRHQKAQKDNMVLEEKNMEKNQLNMRTDSMIALHWIRSPAQRWKPFVANRVTEIQELTNPESWSHCAGKMNPADLPTRGQHAKSLIESQLWWSGPTSLHAADKAQDIDNDHVVNEVNTELKSKHQAVVQLTSAEQTETLLNLEKYSRLKTVLRITAWLKRFVTNLRSSQKVQGALTAEELIAAETHWVKITQERCFSSEISQLRLKQNVKGESKLRDLRPFLDENGLLSVGGRLQNSDISFREQHPWILPTNHKFSELLVISCHERVMHSGIRDTLIQLREHYWILRGRQLVKRLISGCCICGKLKVTPAQQITAPLPRDRVTESPPFEVTGVYFAGPLYVKVKGHQPVKAYTALFICAVTRAVHLELVSDQTTENFLLALKRFIARRGLCRIIYSDNAKTFKRADKDLKEVWNTMKESEISLRTKGSLGSS